MTFHGRIDLTPSAYDKVSCARKVRSELIRTCQEIASSQLGMSLRRPETRKRQSLNMGIHRFSSLRLALKSHYISVHKWWFLVGRSPTLFIS